MNNTRRIKVHALSNADALGYRGQQAVSEAVADGYDYRIVGGHMVRLLLTVYPTPNARLRSTLDADAAVENVEVIGHLSERLVANGFSKVGGNVFYSATGGDQRIEINLLVPRDDSTAGIRPRTVPGVGQVDSLPELGFVLLFPGLVLEVEADLDPGHTIEYRTRIPDLEAAVVLKAHSWKGRSSPKDLADLHSLLEIRDAHPDTTWLLDSEKWMSGFRKDTARILHHLAGRLTRRSPGFPVPDYLDNMRMAGLIIRHISS